MATTRSSSRRPATPMHRPTATGSIGSVGRSEPEGSTTVRPSAGRGRRDESHGSKSRGARAGDPWQTAGGNGRQARCSRNDVQARSVRVDATPGRHRTASRVRSPGPPRRQGVRGWYRTPPWRRHPGPGAATPRSSRAPTPATTQTPHRRRRDRTAHAPAQPAPPRAQPGCSRGTSRRRGRQRPLGPAALVLQRA
jgi:hypothetical protein